MYRVNFKNFNGIVYLYTAPINKVKIKDYQQRDIAIIDNIDVNVLKNMLENEPNEKEFLNKVLADKTYCLGTNIEDCLYAYFDDLYAQLDENPCDVETRAIIDDFESDLAKDSDYLIKKYNLFKIGKYYGVVKNEEW